MTLSSNALIVKMFPSLEKSSALKFVSLALLGTLLLTLSAKVNVPFYPVKMSMQSFAVIFLGCMYGSRLAATTVALYLFEAALGLPVLQGMPDRGIGLAYMMGPTAGYLIGFLASAFIVGKLTESGMGKNTMTALLLFILGAVIIDIPGVAWLAYLTDFNIAKLTYISYQYGFILKTGLGAVLVPLLWNRSLKNKPQ